MSDVLRTDVLVVGGGGAATRAAYEAKKAGAEVILATKGTFGAIGTRGAGATSGANSEFGVFATPGWTGPVSELEKPLAFKLFNPPEEAFANIIQVGLGMTDPRLAEIVVEEAVETRKTLLDLGAAFGEPGIWSHGVPIVQALVGAIRRADVPVLGGTMIVSLLVRDEECCGAVAIDEKTGKITVIEAGATILATGGDANLFLLNLNPSDNTGDGYALGYEAGAELVNMEFKQVFLGTVYPTKNMLLRVLHPHTRIINDKGEEFLPRYLPPGVSVEECLAQRQLHNPFSTRDALSRYVDIGIVGEVRSGRGTANSGVWLDRSDPAIPPIDATRNEFWRYRGIDFTKAVEIGVCHHCSLGGFRIDENGQTSVRRLYAAGELAAGPHGADRLAGHMLLAAQVYGARAGRHAAGVGNRKMPDLGNAARDAEERIESTCSGEGTYRVGELRTRLRRRAYFDLLLVRSAEGLNRFLDEVKGLGAFLPSVSAHSPSEAVELIELGNLLLLARIEAAVCLRRTESRGPHYREDFPGRDDRRWLKSITVRKAGGGPELGEVVFDPRWENRGDEKVKMWG